MGKFDNIYPRGVVIDREKSATLIREPEEAGNHPVYWLNRNGIVYKTLLDAIYYEGKTPATHDGSNSITPDLTALRQSDEKFIFIKKSLSDAYLVPTREDSKLLGAGGNPLPWYRRVSTIDVPFAMPVSTKPGDHSTVWISKSDRAYPTRKLAMEDDPNKAIGSLGLAAASIVDALAEFLFGSTFGWLLLIIAVLLILRMFKKKKGAPAPLTINP
jgi:hypothetical protein